MNSYSLQASLRSYFINKELLKNIEEYLRNDVLKMLNVDNALDHFSQDQKLLFALSLFDSFGEEKFKSVSEYKYGAFQDSINALLIEYSFTDSNTLQELKISLRLGKSASSNNLSLHLNDDNAREKVKGIQEGLLRVMSYNKTGNWIFFFNSPLTSLIFMVTAMGALIFQDRRQEKYPLFWIFYLAVIIILFVNVNLKRYSTFESKRQMQIDKGVNWFLLGLASFVLFSTIFPILRKSLLGF